MVRVSLRSFCLLLACLSLVGCVSHTHTPYLGPVSDSRPAVEGRTVVVPAANRTDFQPSRITGAPIVRRDAPVPWERNSRHHTVETWVLETGRARGDVVFTYYRSALAGPHPLVVVAPIWGSATYPQRKVVKKLLQGAEGRKAHVLALHGQEPLFHWPLFEQAETETDLDWALESAARRILERASDMGRMVRWAARRPEVDGDRIGIVGFSISAIVSSLVMAHEERVAGGVFVMGGGHLHQIFGSCRGTAGKIRNQLQERFRWTPEQFVARVEEPLAVVNPVHYVTTIASDRVLMIDAAYDRCVPETGREDFWQALGRPERLTLDYGHKVAFLSMSPLGFHVTTRKIARFLRRKLAEGPPKPARPQGRDTASKEAGFSAPER